MIAVTETAEIAKTIKQTRLSQGLTQPDLAGAAGTSIRFIVELEKGKPTCQVEKVLHVLAMLGIGVYLDAPAEQATTENRAD